MVDTRLIKHSQSKRPKMNPDVVSDNVQQQTLQCEQYLREVWQCAAESFPPGVNLIGLERCTPYEQYRETVRPPKPTRSFNLAKSDLYMVKLRIEVHGVEIRPRYFFLPFGSAGNMFNLNGTLYNIMMIVGGGAYDVDKSVDKSRIYVWTPRAPLVFNKGQYSFINNGVFVNTDYIYTRLYNVRDSSTSSKFNCTLLHYILMNHGLTETMKQYYGIDIEVGGPELDARIGSDEWFVCASAGLPPGGKTRKRTDPDPSQLRFAIKAQDYNIHIERVIGTLFYIIDCFPNTVTAEDIDNPELWLRLLSRFIFRETESERRMYDEMCQHKDSVEHYMDRIMRNIMHSSNIKVNTIYELLHYFSMHFHDIVDHHESGSLYNQEMTLEKHLLYHTVHNIFITLFELKTLTGDRISPEKVTSILDSKLRRDRILTVSGRGELSPDAIATDCLPYKATCTLLPKGKANTRNGQAKADPDLDDPSLAFHPTWIETSSPQMMTKADPTGAYRVNPFVRTRRGVILPSADNRAYMENFRKLF